MPRYRCLGRCGRFITHGSYCRGCDPYKKPGWAALSHFIIERDNGICHLCGKPGADTADHLTPAGMGGTDAPSNLAAAHRACNSEKRGTGAP